MKRRVPSVLVGAFAVLALVYLGSLRNELEKLPSRVGPLHSQLPAVSSLRLFALGDTGTGGESQLRVAAAMEERCKAGSGASAILLLGDNAYDHGFSSVDDPQWQTKVLGPFGSECLKGLPIYPVLGQADYKGNPQAEIDFSLVNSRWRFPNRFYDVRFGDLLQLVAFDSQMAELCLRPAYCTVDFLASNIRPRHAVWTFVMAHHPLGSSSGQGFSFTGGFSRLTLKPYLCNKVDLWLSGHARHLEHRQPEGCQLELFVSGGGGGELFKVAPGDAESRFAEATNGFLELDLDAEKLTARFIDDSGKVLYETTKLPQPR